VLRGFNVNDIKTRRRSPHTVAHECRSEGRDLIPHLRTSDAIAGHGNGGLYGVDPTPVLSTGILVKKERGEKRVLLGKSRGSRRNIRIEAQAPELSRRRAIAR